jgi:hypothetical protein
VITRKSGTVVRASSSLINHWSTDYTDFHRLKRTLCNRKICVNL